MRSLIWLAIVALLVLQAFLLDVPRLVLAAYLAIAALVALEGSRSLRLWNEARLPAAGATVAIFALMWPITLITWAATPMDGRLWPHLRRFLAGERGLY